MKLVLDIGNTLAKAALFDGDSMVWIESIPTDSPERLIDSISPLDFRASILSSVAVVPQGLSAILKERGNHIEMNTRTLQPLSLDYETPNTLGVDRLAAANGAHAMHPGRDVLVVVAGTCITYDIVSEDGLYMGGAISPGITMRLNAMHTFTAKLPLLSSEMDPTLLGKSTKNSMLSGAVNGAVEEVMGMITRYRTEFSDLHVIISGGDLPFFDKCLENSIFAVPNIVLKGLNEILDFNITTDAHQ